MKRIFAGLLICIALTAGCGKDSKSSGPKASAKAAKDFTVTTLDGRNMSLSDFSGKVVILDFWATWCPPCRAEIPMFVELYRDYRNKGLEILGVSVDQGGPAGVRRFASDNKINFNVAMANNRIVNTYGPIRSIPTTFVLDKKGRIRQKFIGGQRRATFENLVNKLLAEK